jgi:hypothetical protein
MAINIPEGSNVSPETKEIDGVVYQRIVITGPWVAQGPQEAPHSRACGPKKHKHGRDCSENCPSCHGKETITGSLS